jgi:hypothetical protein
MELSIAATVPATCVPCPSPSFQLGELLPPAKFFDKLVSMLRSVTCAIPVSIMNILPLGLGLGFIGPFTRLIPHGVT